METRLTKPQVISALAKSPHGNLAEYVPIALSALADDAEFFGHLVAWNALHGQVRDAKVALPVLALFEYGGDQELGENAVAHLAALDPRLLVKALEFAEQLRRGGFGNTPTVGIGRTLRRLVTRYLRDREAYWPTWEATALQHRQSLRTLYGRWHVKPSAQSDAVLFKGEAPGKFGVLRALATMSAEEAAGAVVANKLPFLAVRGALGKRAKDPDILLALISRMSSNELTTNMKALERLGVRTVPALRAALEEALAKKPRKGTAALKTTRAAEALEASGDTQLATKLRATQERQLDALGQVEGDWLVLGDKSGSMATAIETARQVSAILARMVKGRVHLVFFDTSPRYYDVTGMDYEQLKKLTGRVVAGGGTSIGCGLQHILETGTVVQGIAVVSDGGENNTPYFAKVYQQYAEKLAVEPTVYLYLTEGDSNDFSESCKHAEIDVQTFDLRGSKLDYYSLPNIVTTMRTNRYGLLDEVLAVPLLKVDAVLQRTKGQPVLLEPAQQEVGA